MDALPLARARLRAAIVVTTAAIAAGAAFGTDPARAAIEDVGGSAVPATETTGLAAQLDGPAGCRGGGCALLAEPGSPGNDDAEALAGLGRSTSPEEDLAAALDRLARATTAEQAAEAQQEALAILEGRPLAGRAYSGIPLLNWNSPAKVKTVPAGGTVDITQIRTPGHSATDTWMLAFEDPAQPYTIRYRITELGGAYGGELRPAPLLEQDGRRLGGLHSVLLPLATPALATGTTDASRFTGQRGLPQHGAPEQTRLATQTIAVRMPPPHLTRAILDPSARPHDPALLTLHPATPERIQAAGQALGFTGTEPTDEQRTHAIERLAPAAPETQLWADLRALDTNDLDAANALGTHDRALVGAMRTRTRLPQGVAGDAGAHVTVVIQNNEAYVSQPRVRLPAGERARVHVVNRDGFAHDLEPLALHGRDPVLGADDWGRFDWSPLPGDTIAAGAAQTVELDVPADAFALWLGDPNTGDQASAVVDLDRGPLTESITVDPDDGATPLHQALDADGDLWITLEGTDTVVEVRPHEDLDGSTRRRTLIPGGAHSAQSDRLPLGPNDIAVDERGHVWVTLSLGNAIARIDPEQTQPGTDQGVRVYPLTPCADDECAEPFLPDPGERLSREPLQMEVTLDARGNAVVWFAEAAADRIGVLRVAPDGTELGQTHMTCGCQAPLGLALDRAGDVWFTEAISNRIGRLTPGSAEPYSASAARLRHYPIPSAVLTVEPELSRVPVLTSLPHSVTLDARGDVWFTESATGKVGVLDPGTGAIDEIDLPATDFGAPAAPADLVVDRAGTLFWADEYGDIVGTVGADRRPGRSHRPAARRSLTDSPVTTPEGDLLWIESAANLLTRVTGVTAGNPLPAAPPRIELDTAAGRIAVSGLRDTERITGAVGDASREVATPDGAATVELDVEAGDTVRVTQHQAHPVAPLVHVVPTLAAERDRTGVRGRATRDGEPLADRVLLDGTAAAIDPQTGRFTHAGDASTITWTQATPGAVYTTSTAVADADPEVEPPKPPPPPDPEAPEPRAPKPQPPVVTQPHEPCPARAWMTGTRRAPAFPLLGMTGSRLAACFGRAPAGIALTMRDGAVTAITLTRRGWASGGLKVGAPIKAIRRALPAKRTGRRTWRAVVTTATGLADVRVRTARRVIRIEVRATTRARLDRAGRALLR